MPDAVQIQREYYARTAADYDAMHVDAGERDEHYLAAAVMSQLLDYYRCESILDVGAGTGRTMLWLQNRVPNIRVAGVEPVAELRDEGYRKGVPRELLVDGDATRLGFPDGAFDAVCCFGVLHHVANPALAVREMLRVTRKMIFISDSNNFGQGGRLMRLLKQCINAVGLWPAANFFKTRGRGYSITEGDGLAYSYSAFNDYPLIRSACEIVHVINTLDSKTINPYRGASHVAIAGIKKSN